VHNLHKENIYFFACSVLEPNTRKMFKVIDDSYPNPPSIPTTKPPQKRCNVNPKNSVFSGNIDVARFHFVFCLDTSSSMKGDRWNGLKVAMTGFIRERVNYLGQGDYDQLSIIGYANEHRLYLPTSATDPPVVLKAYSEACLMDLPYGGTSFVAGLCAAQSALAKTASGLIPFLVFMSDGEDGSAEHETLEKCKQIKSRHVQLRSHMVLAFGGGGAGRMTKMKDAFGGSFIEVKDAVELVKEFRQIVLNHSPSQTIVDEVAKAVISDIVDSIASNQ